MNQDLTIAPPTSRKGEELRMGPFRVLQRTDGRYVVLDDRGALGEADVYLAGWGRSGLREAVVELGRSATAEGFKVGDPWPAE